MKIVIQIVVFIMLNCLQSYVYSSAEEVEKYTKQCKNFLNNHSVEFKDESFEKLLGYFGNAMICKKEKVYDRLTEDEKDKLKEVSLKIEEIKKRLPKEKLERVNESIAAIMPVIERDLWEDLTKEELNELDILLRSKWNSMRKSIEQNDIDKAVSYFHRETRDMYWKNFAELSPENRRRISKDLTDISMRNVEMNTAIYEVTSDLRTGEKVSFRVIFIKDIDGEWVIRSF